jgi:hypothetical protein
MTPFVWFAQINPRVELKEPPVVAILVGKGSVSAAQYEFCG